MLVEGSNRHRLLQLQRQPFICCNARLHHRQDRLSLWQVSEPESGMIDQRRWGWLSCETYASDLEWSRRASYNHHRDHNHHSPRSQSSCRYSVLSGAASAVCTKYNASTAAGRASCLADISNQCSIYTPDGVSLMCDSWITNSGFVPVICPSE